MLQNTMNATMHQEQIESNNWPMIEKYDPYVNSMTVPTMKTLILFDEATVRWSGMVH